LVLNKEAGRKRNKNPQIAPGVRDEGNGGCLSPVKYLFYF